MSRDNYFTLGCAIVAIILVVVQIMNPPIPPNVGWTLVAIFGALAILFFIRGIRKKENKPSSIEQNKSLFYLRIWNISYRLLSDPLRINAQYKASMSFDLTISNQQNIPRGVSRFVLGIEFQDGTNRELCPMESDNQTKAKISLYLQPHQPETVWLNFVYDKPPVDKSQILYVYDDRGAYRALPINVDTGIQMAKKSKSRSGDYLIE